MPWKRKSEEKEKSESQRAKRLLYCAAKCQEQDKKNTERQSPDTRAYRRTNERAAKNEKKKIIVFLERVDARSAKTHIAHFVCFSFRLCYSLT